tara:strand:- start:14434 stop:14853 length:420 start_codon:yes stop_codon:yes gene_type:complete
MSNDKLDKNGVWQGNQKEYYDFAINILDDACDGEQEQFVESMLSDILKEIPQDKLESIVSKHCEALDDQLDEVLHNQNRLGLLIKVNENEVSPIEPIESPIVDPNDLNPIELGKKKMGQWEQHESFKNRNKKDRWENDE